MADLASSSVVVLDSWYASGLDKRIINRKLRVTLSSMGTTTNKIKASVLGFHSIEGPVTLIASDNSIMLVGTPSYDGTLVLLKAAGTNAPADFSGTFIGVFVGRPVN